MERFIYETGIYFFCTQMGMGVVGERHERFLGTAALSDKDYVHCAIERSDLIVNVGHDVVEKPPFFMGLGGKKVIHVNFIPAQVDNVYFPQVEVIGDLATSIDRMTASIGKDYSLDNGYFFRVKVDVEKYLTNKDDDPRFPIVPQRLVADARRAMPSDGIACLDNGIYKVGSLATTRPMNPTRFCWTKPWLPLEHDCHQQWGLKWFSRIARFSPFAATLQIHSSKIGLKALNRCLAITRWPASFGWIPSFWLYSGSPPTPSSKKGMRSASNASATSGYNSLKAVA